MIGLMSAAAMAEGESGCDICRVAPFATAAKQVTIEILREIMTTTAGERAMAKENRVYCRGNDRGGDDV
jgi:hypothetical protein